MISMDVKLYSERRTIFLNLPYKIELLSSNGLALLNDSTQLTAKLINSKTGEEVSNPSGIFSWKRIEDGSSFTTKYGQSITIETSDLSGDSSTFTCTYYEDGEWWRIVENITIAKTIKGDNGWSSFNLTLYKRSETEPATFDGGDLTYTFGTNSLEGNLGTWSRDIPTDSTDPVWAIYALAFAQASSDEIPSTRWTSPARLSTEGTAGAKGDSVVTIFIFQKSETKPATPTANVSYNLTSGEISNISPWSKNVPAGSDRVWVSLATGVTNSDSIVILPARWSSPEIFREKGDTGKGIQSVTTYYLVSAQNTGITRDTDGWEPTPQTTTSTLKYLWQYTETLWTDGIKTYTEPVITGTHGEQGAQGEPGKDGADGEDGKDGADAPEVQIQYAWGMSNTVEPSPSIWLFDGKFFVWNGQFVGSTELWSYTRTKKPQDGNLWYEWIRWSTDGGKTWKKPQCLTSDYIIDFDIEISPATYAMTSRQYVKTLQVLTLHCRKTNYVGSSQAVWTIPAKETTADGETIENYISFSNADGSELYESNTRTGDTVYVAVQEGCMMTSFPVKCSLEGLGEKELAVAGSYDAFTSEYIGTVDATIGQSFPTFIEGKGPVLAGDMVVYIWQNAEGTKMANYYVCIDPTKPNTDGWSPYAEDTHHNSQLMISGIYDAIMSGADNTDMIRMIENLVAHYIAAQFIRITGAIYGGEYKENGDKDGDGSGFWLGLQEDPSDKDKLIGILKAFGAELTNVTAENGSFSGKFKSQGFETVDELPSISSADIQESYRDYWNNADTYISGTLVENKFHTYSLPGGYYVGGVASYKNEIYLMAYNSSSSSLMKSTDGGYSFSTIDTFNIIQASVSIDEETGFCWIPISGKEYRVFYIDSPGIQSPRVVPFYVTGTYIKKVNNMFFAVNYFLHSGDLYYVSSTSSSSDWTKTQVSIDDIVYSNGNWIGVRLNSSLATYIGPSLSSMQSRSVSIPQLPSTMEYKGIAASDNSILCILLTKNASTGQGKGIYILACSNLTAATLSFSLITISSNDSDKAGNIVYKNGIFLIRNNGSNKIHWSVNGTTWNTSSNNFDMLSDMTTPVNSVSVYCRYGWVVPGQSKIHILPQFNNTKFTSFFLSVKSKLLSTVISPAVEPLSYEHEVSATFVDSAGATHSITSLKAYQNGIIEFSDSQGNRYRFGDTHLYPITINNLVIAAEQASINITSMNPMNDHTDIGKDGQRIRNIWAEKYDGDVNSKGTSHVVWGAVAN